MTTPAPPGWRIWSDRGWMHFTRPDGFTQAVTDHEPKLSHAETLHMLLQALAAQAPAQQAAPFALNPNETDPTVLWAEIARLQAAVAGPDGYASWQEAATAERLRRVRAEKAIEAQQAAQPVAWRIQQGARVYFVSASEFSRSSYDHGSFVPLYTAAPAPVGLVPLSSIKRGIKAGKDSTHG